MTGLLLQFVEEVAVEAIPFTFKNCCPSVVSTGFTPPGALLEALPELAALAGAALETLLEDPLVGVLETDPTFANGLFCILS